MWIESATKNVEEFLDNYFLVIPRFQRPYAWKREHLEEFWNDTVADRNGADYFIGSLVLYKSGKRELAIVDGQQRVTTLLLVFCALRDAFHDLGHDDEAEGIQNIVERPGVLNNKLRYTLRTETSHPYIQEYVFKRAQPSVVIAKPGLEEENVSKAYKYLKTRIASDLAAVDTNEEIEDDNRAERKFEVLKSIRDGLFGLTLLAITLETEDDACTIFETLNARGMDLSVGQLAKNHFAKFIEIDNSDVDPLKEKWTALHGTLSGTQSVSVDTYLHHHWLSRRDYVTKKKLFKKFKEFVGSNNAAKVLDELVNEAPIYNSVMDPWAAKWEKKEYPLRDQLVALFDFGVTQPAPLLFSLVRSYKMGTIKLKAAKRVATALAHFHFAFTAIAGKSSSGGRSMMYAAAAKKLAMANSKNEAADILNETVEKISEKWPSLEEFKVGFQSLLSSAKHNAAHDRKIVRYTLDTLWRHTQGVDPGSLTLEHLASQRKPGGVDDRHVAMLGNLCLVTDVLNNSLDNKSPGVKSPLLRKAQVPHLEQFHLNSKRWTNEAIEDRTAELADFGYKHVWLRPQ